MVFISSLFCSTGFIEKLFFYPLVSFHKGHGLVYIFILFSYVFLLLRIEGLRDKSRVKINMKNTHISEASSIIEKQNESSMVAPTRKVDGCFPSEVRKA